MSTSDYQNNALPAIPLAAGSVLSASISLRMREKSTSFVRAYADAEITIDGLGSAQISGFAVYHGDGKDPVVLPPAKQGQRKSFPIVRLSGKVRGLVEALILAEYAAALKREG